MHGERRSGRTFIRGNSMDFFQTAGILILIGFYAVYFIKMVRQRRNGIRTDQIGKGSKPKDTLRVEKLMKAATCCVVVVEITSIAINANSLPDTFRIPGLVLGCAGVTVFFAAVLTMKDSWRAGIPENEKTKMVTAGIYRLSRNPAFLGFDLVYIGMLLMFFNAIHLLFAAFAMIMLHLQILQEERYLPSAFGEEYARYKAAVRRYIGRL